VADDVVLMATVVPDGVYKIFNVKWGGPLFCGEGTDSGGDHHIWVEQRRNYENKGKELWDVEKQKDGTYKIRNARWGCPLFCADSKSNTGDHYAFGEPRKDYENNGKERWTIDVQENGTVKLSNGKWGGRLFCGDGTDSGGDHRVWIEPRLTYENNGKERWEMRFQGNTPSPLLGLPPIPMSGTIANGRYKLFNVKWGGPMFCGEGKDSGGDHHIWVEPRRNYENQGKELWDFEKQDDGTWKIRNARWGCPLFCGDSKDNGGDHYAFGEPRKDYENNGKERWYIQVQDNGTLKLSNGKWGGRLFCGDGMDSGGDHRVWIEPRLSYENKGKESWELRLPDDSVTMMPSFWPSSNKDLGSAGKQKLLMCSSPIKTLDGKVVMDLLKDQDLQFVFDWPGSSNGVPEDKEHFDQIGALRDLLDNEKDEVQKGVLHNQIAAIIQSTRWWQRYEGGLIAGVKMAAQGTKKEPLTILMGCLKGGLISQFEEAQMARICQISQKHELATLKEKGLTHESTTVEVVNYETPADLIKAVGAFT